jgi:hypothetical protein
VEEEEEGSDERFRFSIETFLGGCGGSGPLRQS